jgi:DNA-binding MarR family transcriptional regulator
VTDDIAPQARLTSPTSHTNESSEIDKPSASYVVYMHYMMREDIMTPREMVESCLCAKTRAAARSLTSAYDETLRPVGLRATQLAVLAAVAIDGSVSITALAKLLSMDRSTLSRNLGPLEESGLVKIGIEGWRRSRMLAITKTGEARLAMALPLWERAQKTLREKLGDREWANASRSLDRLLSAS